MMTASEDTERRVPAPRFDARSYRQYADVDRTRAETSVVIPPDSGRSIVVPRGSIFRLTCPEGPQVADVCFFNREDPAERLWANQTLNREGVYVSTGSRLWGTMPRFRPLATLIADSVADRSDPTATPHHIVLGAHCNPWMWLVATGRQDHPNCYDQLCSAVADAGIPEHLIHDNINFFQRTRIDAATHAYVTEPSGAQAGDYVELVAEVELTIAVSTCPMGSGRHRAESGNRDPLPLIAEVFTSGFVPQEFSYLPSADATGVDAR